nr:unnamed protein product [Spirometra erinaceieuropaei]
MPFRTAIWVWSISIAGYSRTVPTPSCRSKRSFELSADVLTAFDKLKVVLADATLLTHFSPDALISLMDDAYNVASSSLKSDLDCFAAALVFGATVRLPGENISPTPRFAIEDPTNLLHSLRQFMRTLSLVPLRPSVSSLTSSKIWRHALTSTTDVIESAGPWNQPTTAASKLSLVGRRTSASNAELARRS